MTEEKYSPHQLIKDAAKHGELVVFVGAGASKLCGSPSWQEFSHQVVTALEGAGYLSFLEAEQLRTLGDSRRTLSIAMDLANEAGVRLDFDKILHPDKPSPVGLELYELLASVRPVFVTTNYDRWLDEESPEIASGSLEDKESVPTSGPSRRPRYCRREDLTSEKLAERGAVIHLHGSYTDPDSMVVSLRDYIEHYADKRVQAFLAEMFRNYTVLFVGYGLAEMEVLDHIIRSNESLISGKAEPRHFLLYAHRSSESAQTGFIERFFRDQCGVQVVPYCIDAAGYREVVEVFRSWISQLDVRDPNLLELHAQIDRYVASGKEQEAAIRLVNRRPELATYFVNSLKDPAWFESLDRAGFFNVENSPGVAEISNANGTMYQAEGWPALRYLEHVAPLASDDQATRIAEIVRQISTDAENRGLGNWRTWWSLATIISHLPLNEISESDIEMSRRWLLGSLDANIIGKELGGRLLPRLLESTDPADEQKSVMLVDVLSMMRTGDGS